MRKFIVCAVAVLGLGLFAQSQAEAQSVRWGVTIGNGGGFYGHPGHHPGNWNRGPVYRGPVYGPGCHVGRGPVYGSPWGHPAYRGPYPYGRPYRW